MVSGRFQVYGEDLANLEDKEKELRKEHAKLLSQSLPRRQLNKVKIDNLAKSIEATGYKIMSVRELVMANPTSAKLYEKAKQDKAQEAAEDKKLKQEKTAGAEAGLREVPKKEIENQKSGKDKAAETMAYLAHRKEARQKAKDGATPDAAFMKLEEEKKKKRQRDNEWEPE